MGSFRVSIEIGDPKSERFEPEEQRDFILADGRSVQYGVATALIRVDGRVKPTPVVFGDDDTEPLLGVITLEEFGPGVDALNERLIPTPGCLSANS